MPEVVPVDGNIDIREIYNPFPIQESFHGSSARYRLYFGGAGAGKTLSLLWEGVFHCLEFANTNSILLRRTFKELESSVIDHYLRYVHPHRKVLGIRRYLKSNHSVEFLNGSKLMFGHCEHEKDVYQYQGDEFLFIGFDEISHFTFRMWDFLKSRNRCPVRGSRPNMAGATNPCGPGVQWLKKLFHEKKPAPGMGEETYNPADYDCIQTTVFDNPVYANDANYISGLRSLAPDLRAQMLDGAWDVVAGQYFHVFSPDIHTRDFNEIPFQEWQPRWISIDWAYSPSWTMVYWHTIVTLNAVTAKALGIPLTAEKRDIVVTYREAKFQECGSYELAMNIANLMERDKAGNFLEDIKHIYLSPDCFQRSDGPHTIASEFSRYLRQHKLTNVEEADNDREGGWTLMLNKMILGEWLITKNCRILIEALPGLVRSEKKQNDIVKVTPSIFDDAADSARYGLKSFLSPRKKPSSLEHAEHVSTLRGPDGLPDFQRIHMANMQYQREKLKKGSGGVVLRRVPRWKRDLNNDGLD